MSNVAKEILNNQDDLEEEIKKLFDKIDTDHSKEIDKKEFRIFVKKLYEKSGKIINNELIDKFIKNYDKDKSGMLNLDEFREYAIKVLEVFSQGKYK